MSYDYSGLIGTAARLIDRFGRGVVRTRTTGGGTDPVTGVVTAGLTSTDTFRGINKIIPQDLIDGTRILATDRMIVLEAVANPEMTDKLDGFSVAEIQEIRPADAPIVWLVRVRK